MIQDDKFGANRDQGSFEAMGRTARRRGGALASAFVIIGLAVASTMAIAARAHIVSIAPATAAAYALAGNMNAAKTALAEALRVQPKLTMKFMTKFGPPIPNLFDGLRKAGLPEE